MHARGTSLVACMHVCMAFRRRQDSTTVCSYYVPAGLRSEAHRTSRSSGSIVTPAAGRAIVPVWKQAEDDPLILVHACGALILTRDPYCV